jgi:hypothetical protein
VTAGDGDGAAARLLTNTCAALACGALRLKPRERQLALLLAVESFGRGRGEGVWNVEWFWDRLKPEWRLNELRAMLAAWRRAGWIAVDAAAGEFRLAPDRLPGWAECFLGSDASIPLPMGDGQQLGPLMAELSQERAAGAKISHCLTTAKFSQCANPLQTQGKTSERAPAAKFSQLRDVTTFPETFNRSDVTTNKRLERLTLGANCENFAPDAAALAERVRQFVGEADWANPKFWNSGAGYRGTIFREEGAELARALDYVQAGLRSGEASIRKTRGAMLWDQFQRERRRME